MSLKPDDFRKACDDYRDRWELTDSILYEVCQRHPGHGSLDVINAKVLLIGRGYMTGIERAIRSQDTQGSSLEQLASFLQENAKCVDHLISRLVALTNDISQHNQVAIISEHARFVQLLQKLTRDRLSTRSFVSKYLHFHCPQVPIFDNIAASWMPTLVSKKLALPAPDGLTDADEVYLDYVLRFWALLAEARRFEPEATVKHVDNYVLWYAPSPHAASKHAE